MHGKCERNVGEATKQQEKLCDEVDTVKELTYLGDRVRAGEGCEAAVTVRIRCAWVNLRECGMRFPPQLKSVYKNNVRPAILYENESWCLRESKMEILQRQ